LILIVEFFSYECGLFFQFDLFLRNELYNWMNMHTFLYFLWREKRQKPVNYILKIYTLHEGKYPRRFLFKKYTILT